MYKIFSIFFLMLPFIECSSQVTSGINYQGVARDGSGHPLLNQNLSIRLSILDSSTTGQAIYVETHNVTTNNTGLFNLSIGSGAFVAGIFTNIPWDKGDKWLQIEMDKSGGNNFLLVGTTQFLSVPYALYAKNGNKPGVSTGDILYWDGTSWENLSVGNVGQVLTLNANKIPTWKNPDLSVGDLYQGGIVAYILRPGDPGYDANIQHGLIAATSDIGPARWGCYPTELPGADGTALGSGEQNTFDIITGCNSQVSAAYLCNIFVSNGYSDWYLPSKEELNKLYENRGIISNFSNSSYWSSSEYTNTYAWALAFYNGTQDYSLKDNQFNVRAVRTF